MNLIANTGIQFYTTEITIDPQAILTDAQGLALPPLYFTESLVDIVQNIWSLEYCIYLPISGNYVKYSDLKSAGYITDEGYIYPENLIDLKTLPIVPAPDYQEFTLMGDQLANLVKGNHPLECFENEWIPMPFFEKDFDIHTMGPTAWCRMKLIPIEIKKNGERRYKVVWAFDTASSINQLSIKQPYFFEGEISRSYGLRNDYVNLTDAFGNQRLVHPSKSLLLLCDFFNESPHECGWVDNYILSLLYNNRANANIPDGKGGVIHFRYMSYYFYFVYYLGMKGLYPEVTLFQGTNPPLEVDMVLDIGNSRTCGVLFENSDFTKVENLHLRDFSEPWKVYTEAFDMRLAFHRTKFGEMEIDGVFEVPSILRIGKEANRLIYEATQADGTSAKTTHYSSPKRYLWDDKEYEGQWEFLQTEKDPYSWDNLIYVKGLSEQFNSDGTLRESGIGGVSSSFSRRSLMTFVFIEILQQAESQINSYEFRKKHGNTDIRRVIKRIIITCPTAMSKVEQKALRQCAEDAYLTLQRFKNTSLLYETNFDLNAIRKEINVIPPVEDISRKGADVIYKKEWDYDEATCCQLVYLYGELSQRYMNNCKEYFKHNGKKRKEFLEEGYTKEALTIGSIDIGAGTVDLMICSYKYNDENSCKLTPIPLFWESFYYAGDDILKEIVQQLILEGPPNATKENSSIYQVLTDHLDKKGAADPGKTASNLLRTFFEEDNNNMNYTDRIMRNDFNIQVSVPIALQFLELLRTAAPDQELSYTDLFPVLKPAKFIMDYFENHFGFRFESIKWKYNSSQISRIIVSKLEDLMKQISLLLNAYKCDIVLLAGKPTSLKEVTDLFLKLYPVSPDRLIRLNDYHVGNWYPFADGRGFFLDQKSIVAVGAMIGYKASNGGLNGFFLDMTEMKKRMAPTSRYLGLLNTDRKIETCILTPTHNSTTQYLPGLPIYIGCKQLDSRYCEGRPLYMLASTDGTNIQDIKVSFSRNYHADREELIINQITDQYGNILPMDKFRFGIQTLGQEGVYWLDKGEFKLSIR